MVISRALSNSHAGATPAAFYCVSSAIYFLGAVAMINSLRLAGHDEPVFVLACGLTARQRELLEPHATLVEAPADRAPFALKTLAPLRHPAEVMVLIDADMAVTRSLTELIERAAQRSAVAFANHADRFVPEWGELLDLGPLRRQPYVSSGLLAIARSPGQQVLELMADRQTRVDLDRSYFGSHAIDYALLYSDQDLLNAILASRVEADRIVTLDSRLCAETPFEGLEIADLERVRVAYGDGTEPYVVHHALSPKPWQAPGPDGVYTQLLRRLLGSDDVAIRLERSEIPPALRTGALAGAGRRMARLRRGSVK